MPGHHYFGNVKRDILTKARSFAMRPGKIHSWNIGGAERYSRQTRKEFFELSSDLSESAGDYCRNPVESEKESQEDRPIKGMTKKRPPGRGH